MTNFSIKIDTKFDEIIIKLKEKKEISINDIIDLKIYIMDTYHNVNKSENEYIKKSFSMIDFKI